MRIAALLSTTRTQPLPRRSERIPAAGLAVRRAAADSDRQSASAKPQRTTSGRDDTGAEQVARSRLATADHQLEQAARQR